MGQARRSRHVGGPPGDFAAAHGLRGGDMMTPAKLTVSIHDDPPILVCADLQTEYLTEGRSHVIADAEAITARCLALMTLWRGNLWPVIHLKRIAQAAWFNPASNLTDWVAELKPRPGELAFEHPLPSAYSSSRFAEYMANMRNMRCVLAGFSLDETILSTVVDGFHRSHRYQVVARCRGLPPPGDRRCRRLQTGGRQCDRQFCRRRGERRSRRSKRHDCRVTVPDGRCAVAVERRQFDRAAHGAGQRWPAAAPIFSSRLLIVDLSRSHIPTFSGGDFAREC